jgi:hypothetical protein
VFWFLEDDVHSAIVSKSAIRKVCTSSTGIVRNMPSLIVGGCPCRRVHPTQTMIMAATKNAPRLARLLLAFSTSDRLEPCCADSLEALVRGTSVGMLLASRVSASNSLLHLVHRTRPTRSAGTRRRCPQLESGQVTLTVFSTDAGIGSPWPIGWRILDGCESRGRRRVAQFIQVNQDSHYVR